MAVKEDLFRHEPLSHKTSSIRTVQIQPSLSGKGLIQCLITHTTIESEYICLSYAWGPSKPDQTILVNEKPYIVRQNLYDFLQNARARKETNTHFWIDAICINQDDVTERNHQVQQMGNVYRNARCVHIWLGQLASIPSIGALKYPPLLTRMRRSQDEIQEWRRNMCKEDVLRNPYWERSWIYQEVILAEEVKVICKSHILGFRDFVQVIGIETPISFGQHRFNASLLYRYPLEMKSFLRLYSLEPALFDRFYKTNSLARSKIREKPLVRTLINFLTDTKCAIPRDRLFSLLSLCSDGQSITVDYECSAMDLVYDVLKHSKSNVCVCEIAMLKQVLELPQDPSSAVPSEGVFVEIGLPGLDSPETRHHIKQCFASRVDDIAQPRSMNHYKMNQYEEMLDIPAVLFYKTMYRPTCPVIEMLLLDRTFRVAFEDRPAPITSWLPWETCPKKTYLPPSLHKTIDEALQDTLGSQALRFSHLQAYGFSFVEKKTEEYVWALRISLSLVWDFLGLWSHDVDGRCPDESSIDVGVGPWLWQPVNVNIDV